MKKPIFAIIGAGNGGQAFAGYLSAKGYEVRLFDFFDETIKKIKAKGCIKLTGAFESTSTIEKISTNLHDVIDGVDIIMVINPAIYHRKIAKECAKYLNKNQIVFLNPGSTFGAFAFKKALEDYGFTDNITIAESNTLLFACRATEPGVVSVGGKKDRILISAFPASDNNIVIDMLKDAIPEIQPVENVLATSLDNTNPMVHPGPTILNCSWIESGKKFLYYHEGIGSTVADFIEEMDKERLEIGKKIGLKIGENLFSLFMQYEAEYEVKKDRLVEVFKGVDAYKDIYSASDLKTRYIYEDIPMGLLPLVEVGELLNLPVRRMKLIIDMCEGILCENLTDGDNCRNLINLGLENMSGEDIIKYAETGVKSYTK